MTTNSDLNSRQRKTIIKRNTPEIESIKLIEDTHRTMRLVTPGLSQIKIRALENNQRKMELEILRLRKNLISERTHRINLQNSLLPKLKSKCAQVRALNLKLYGHTTKIRKPKRFTGLAQVSNCKSDSCCKT